MLNKTLPSIVMFFLFIILATAEVAAAAPRTAATATHASLTADPDPPPFIVAVVFENGLNTINVDAGSNFTVSINVTDAPAVDFFSIKMQWDPSVMQLKDNSTDLDVLTGDFMDTFWGPSFSGTHLALGRLDDIAGFMSNKPSTSGSGTLFIMLFHAKVLSPAVIITIVTPNIDSYFMLGTTQLNITSVVNGSVIVIPEFSASVLLPLFLVATTIAIAAATLSSRKRRIPHSIS